MLRNGRGDRMAKVGQDNFKRVISWALENPDKTQGQCAEALGLSRLTVNRHIKRAESKKTPAEV